MAAVVVGMIMGIFVGCGDAYAPALKEPVKVSAPTSTEIAALSEQIKQSVTELEYYDDKVAEDFVNMVISWKDKQRRPVLIVWKKQLAKAKEEHQQGRLSIAQLANIEETITKGLRQRIKKEISYNEEFFDLADVIKHKQAQCFSFSQLVYILGNSVGLLVKTIVVEELVSGAVTGDHSASIVGLANRTTVMVDLTFWSIKMRPFKFEKEFRKVGNYWELEDKDNALAVHKRVQIVDRNGLIAGIHLSRGNEYVDLGQFTEAISDYNKTIELNPKFAEGYNNRGLAYVNLGQPTKALSDYNKALELDPKHADTYTNRGNVYADLGEHDKAISDHTRAIELNPKEADYYYNRGIPYENLGQFTKAISDYTKAIKLKPKYAAAYNNRGKVYADLGQFTKAIADYKKAIGLNPKHADYYYNLANTYDDLGQSNKAISNYKQAIKLNPKDAKIYHNLGLKQASFFSLQYNEIDDFAWTQLSCPSRLAG